jgi:hypothetical protein
MTPGGITEIEDCDVSHNALHVCSAINTSIPVAAPESINPVLHTLNLLVFVVKVTWED